MWSSEFATRISNHFKSSHPQLAIRVALQAYTMADDDAQSLIDQGFQLIEQIAQPSATFYQALSQFHRQQDQAQILSNSSKALSDQLANKLVEWYDSLSDQGKTQSFNSVALGLRRRPNLDLFFQHLERETSRLANPSDPAKAGSMSYRTRSRQNNPFAIRPLTFPPELTNYPAHIVSLVLSRPEAPWTQNHYGDLAPLEPEALAKHVETLEDPILKCLVAFQVANQDVSTETIESLLKKNRSADHLLLAAAHAGDHGDANKAVELLLEACEFPIDRLTKGRFQAAIIAYAMDAPEDSPLRIHGKEAALRIRRQAQGPQASDSLMTAMTHLGLEKEADLLAQAASHYANSSRSTWSRGTFSGRTAQQPRHEVMEKLVEEGGEASIIRNSVRELTSLATRYLTTQNFRPDFYQSHSVVDALRLNGLAGKVMRAADPGEQVNGRLLSQFAIICLMFGDADRAHSLLAASLERRPKDEAIRMHYFLSLIEQDRKQAIAQLQYLRPHLLSSLGNGIPQVLSGTLSLEDRAAILDSVLEAVKQVKYSPSTDLRWLVQIVDLLGTDHYQDDISVPSLYIRYPSINIPSTDAAAAKQRDLRDLQRSLHDKFCRALLDVPSLSTLAFSRLTARPYYEGADDADLTEEARQAYLNLQPSPSYQSSSYWNDLDFIPFHAPDLALLRQASRSNTLSELTQEITPLLESKRRKREALLWEHQVEILTCQPPAFVEAAEPYLKRRKAHPIIIRPDPHLGMRRLVDLWKFRQLDASLNPVVLKHLKATKATRHHGRRYLLSYAAHLQNTGRRDETAALFESIAEILLGPPETRKADLAKHYVPDQWSNHTRNADFHLYKEIMRELGKHETLTCLATDASEIFSHQTNNHQSPPLEHFLNSRILSHA
jgi:hypothetical protein